ncbi:MAG: hypothetical protein QW794_01810 [Thermosphaera sp.]
MVQETLDNRLTLPYLLHVFETSKPLVDKADYRIYEVERLGKVYFTMRSYDKHFYRKWGTWGISESYLKSARAMGVNKVVVICKDWPVGNERKMVAWISDIQDWFVRGKSLWWSGEHERQLHLKPEEMQAIPEK